MFIIHLKVTLKGEVKAMLTLKEFNPDANAFSGLFRDIQTCEEFLEKWEIHVHFDTSEKQKIINCLSSIVCFSMIICNTYGYGYTSEILTQDIIVFMLNLCRGFYCNSTA